MPATAWEGAVALCTAQYGPEGVLGVGGSGLDASLSRANAQWDVICGGARARLKSRDSRLGAGSEPAEMALLLGSNRARVESRDLRLGAGPVPAELDRAPSLFTPVRRRARLKSRDLRLGAGGACASPRSQGSLQFQSSTISS